MDAVQQRWSRFWFSMGPAFGSDTAGWYARDPARLAGRARVRDAPLPAIFADVGVDDYLVEDSRAFRDEMRALDVPLQYAEWPGAHTWSYWRAHVAEGLAWLGKRLAM
jgi:S-formylglutathione hydrolase FrmB